MFQEEGKIVAKRRRFSPDFKVRVVLELISGTKTQAEACREYSLSPQTISRWKTEFVEKAPQVFRNKERESAEQVRIAELERMVKRLSLEFEVAKKASAMLNGKLSTSERWS